MSMTFTSNKFGDVALADGRFVRLTQQAWNDNDCNGNAAWFARGYLSTEDAADESGPTVTVKWESLGADNAEDDADWDSPASAVHYMIGNLTLAD